MSVHDDYDSMSMEEIVEENQRLRSDAAILRKNGETDLDAEISSRLVYLGRRMKQLASESVSMCDRALPDTHYVILVEDEGNNEYWTDDGYTWQGTVKVLEEDGRRRVIHYRVVEFFKHRGSLWFGNIGGNPWSELTAGDTIKGLENAREYANQIHPDIRVFSGRSSNDRRPELCYQIAHPNVRTRGFELCIDYLLVIPKERLFLPQIQCNHHNLSVKKGDSSAWWAKECDYIVDHKGGVDLLYEGEWAVKDGAPAEKYLCDIKCNDCDLSIMEEGVLRSKYYVRGLQIRDALLGVL